MAKTAHLICQYRHIAQDEQEITKIWETNTGEKLITFSIQNPEHNYTALLPANNNNLPDEGKIITKLPGRHHKKALKNAGYNPKKR